MQATKLKLNNWIAGETEPSPSQLAELANYFKVEIDYFFTKPDIWEEF